MQQEEPCILGPNSNSRRNEYSILYHASPVAYFTLDPYAGAASQSAGSSLLGRDPGRLLQYPFRSLVFLLTGAILIILSNRYSPLNPNKPASCR
jgi:hypothetical protein